MILINVLTLFITSTSLRKKQSRIKDLYKATKMFQKCWIKVKEIQ